MHKLLSVLLALSLAVGGLAASVYLLGTGSMTMRIVMEHYAPPEDTGLPAAEYKPVADMITAYLSGNVDSFQHVFTVSGSEYAAFNQKEQRHMADVQALFRLCRHAGLTALAAAVLCGWLLRKAFPWRIIRRTTLAILAAVTIVIVLACIDFDSLFVLFHRVAFTNDLWLLDPSTDMLIRLMPIGFFISYAAIIGGVWLLGMAGLLAVSTICIKRTKE